MLDPRHTIHIEYCVPWNYTDRAVGLTDELLTAWGPIIKSVELTPSSKGRFEVTLDGELIFSKASLGRHANPGEVAKLVGQRVGPALLGKAVGSEVAY